MTLLHRVHIRPSVHYCPGGNRVKDKLTDKLTEPAVAAGELGHFWPHMLPDGETVLFTAYAVPVERSRILVYSLRTREHKVLLDGGVSATYD